MVKLLYFFSVFSKHNVPFIRSIIYMGKTETIVPILLFNLFFVLFIVGIIVFIKQYKQKKNEHVVMLAHQTEAHQKELLATQIEIQTQTMQHIGREIHDNIGQKLTLASLYSQQLLYENKAANHNEQIENISKIINQSLEELRELSKSLTDNTIESSTIFKLLTNECNKIEELKICNINLNCSNKKVVLSYPLKAILLRITQEFIQNSIKHTKCNLINIHLEQKNQSITLQLSDDGKGFDTNKKSNGIGLANMKKRTQMLGGNFDLQSSNLGTILNIDLPI
jgi:signal transduction histidine kinase